MADELRVLRSVSKPPLRKGRSYVVKTMELDDALHEAGITTHIDLNYWEPEGTSSIMQCLFWPPSPNAPYDRFYMRAGFVQSAERTAAIEAWRLTGISALAIWMNSICDEPPSSTLRFRDAYFDATWSAGKMFITAHPQKLAAG